MEVCLSAGAPTAQRHLCAVLALAGIRRAASASPKPRVAFGFMIACLPPPHPPPEITGHAAHRCGSRKGGALAKSFRCPTGPSPLRPLYGAKSRGCLPGGLGPLQLQCCVAGSHFGDSSPRVVGVEAPCFFQAGLEAPTALRSWSEGGRATLVSGGGSDIS